MPKNKDGYFRATFVIGKKPDGKPDRVTVRAKTKKELDEKLTEAKRLNAHGVAQKGMTVREWGERWVKVYKANVTHKMKLHYIARLEKNIAPVIGNMLIKDVRASHLQDLLNSYEHQKRGTVAKIRIAIQQLFETAEIEGIIERNPARGLTLPELEEEQRRPLTDFERHIIWDVAQTHKAGTFVLTMLLCGLRRGECIALTVDCLDFKTETLKVIQSKCFETNQGRIKSPKSKAGIREVPIPELLMPMLEMVCSNKKPEDYVFPKADGKSASDIACRRWWDSFYRQCHIKAGAKTFRNKVMLETSPLDNKLTPHYLRHTYATDLYAANVDDKAQKYFMGHASNDVTDIYRKMSEDAFVRAATLLNDYLYLKYLIRNEFKKVCQKCAK